MMRVTATVTLGIAALALAASGRTTFPAPPLASGATAAPNESYPFEDTSLPLEHRVDDLVGRMTLHQKIGNMFMNGKMVTDRLTRDRAFHVHSFGI